jgi:hypothetical protein
MRAAANAGLANESIDSVSLEIPCGEDAARKKRLTRWLVEELGRFVAWLIQSEPIPRLC